MEIFKSNILKKEFERFQKEDLIEVMKCSFCQKTACGSWHKLFNPSCKYCREKREKCHSFNVAKKYY